MTAWIVRAGKFGEREAWAIDQGVAGAGWHEVAGPGRCATPRTRSAPWSTRPSRAAPPGRRANYTGQLWALRGVIKPGDLVVMPMKTTKKIALGVCASGYTYRARKPTALSGTPSASTGRTPTSPGRPSRTTC